MFQGLNWLDDEDVQFEKTCTKGLMTAEEIERLKVDEEMSEVDKAVFLLTTGQDVQKTSIVNRLPDLLRTDYHATMDSVMPKFLETTSTSQSDVLAACGQVLQTVIINELLSSSLVVSMFLPFMWMHCAAKDTNVSKTWLQTLITFISYSSHEVIMKNDIIKHTLAKSHLCQPSSSRINSTQLISTLCHKLDPEEVKKDIYPTISTLCQDVDYDVRIAMCSELVQISSCMGSNFTTSLLISEVYELLSDEELQVKNVAIKTLVDIIPFCEEETIASKVAPALWNVCDALIEDAAGSGLVTIAQLFGKMGFFLKNHMDTYRKKWYCKFFVKLIQLEQEQKSNGLITEGPIHQDITMETVTTSREDYVDCIHYLCGYNFPAVCTIVDSMTLETELLPVYTKLASHSHCSVRRAVAAGVHEIVKILGTESGLLQETYCTILCDTDISVQHAVIPHVYDALLSFAFLGTVKSPNPAIAPGLPYFIQPLMTLECNISKTNSWRYYTQLIESWSSFHNIMTNDQIFTTFAPHLIKQLNSNMLLPVKHSTLSTLVNFMLHARSASQRHDLMTQTIKCLARSKKFNQRVLFVDFCYEILEHFSKKYFKDYCFTPALLLLNDALPRVRIKSCALLPHLKSQLKMPSDRNLLQQLEASSRRSLMGERHKDVLSYIQQAVVELDKTEVKLDSEADPADKLKEEDQNRWIVKEDRNDVKSRTSLPDMSSIDITKDSMGGRKMTRKMSSAAVLTTEHDGHSNGPQARRAQRKMSTVQMRRSSTVANISRRASMPSNNLLEEKNRAKFKSSSAGKRS